MDCKTQASTENPAHVEYDLYIKIRRKCQNYRRIKHFIWVNNKQIFPVLRIRIWDLVPFWPLDLESGMSAEWGSGSRIWDPGWTTQIIFPSQSLETIFWGLKYLLKFFDAVPGSVIWDPGWKNWIRDAGWKKVNPSRNCCWIAMNHSELMRFCKQRSFTSDSVFPTY